MAKRDSSLCSAILKEHFGVIVETVGTAILQHGRNPLGTLVQHTKLSVKQVREALFILIQQGIVKYSEQPVGQRIVVHYLAIPKMILLRDRFAFYIKKILSLHGQLAADIIKILLISGFSNFLTIKENISKILKNNYTDEEISSMFLKLVEVGFIMKLHKDFSLSSIDSQLQGEEKAMKEHGVPMSAKEKLASKNAIAEKLRSIYDESADTGIKRKVVYDIDDIQAKKKTKNMENKIEPECSWKVNYEKFHILFRSDEIQKLAMNTINHAAGEIISKMLKCVELKMKYNLKSELYLLFEAEISFHMLSTQIDKDVKLSVEDTDKLPLQAYLENLEGSDYSFVTKSEDRGGHQYVVNLKTVITGLRKRLLENTITERYGSVAAKIWRVLYVNGKLDDKNVAKLAMVEGKLARDALYQLLNSNLVYMQDVPKTADHSSSRTFFLWGVNFEKCVNNLLLDCYKAVENLKKRRSFENTLNSTLIEKLNRSDVSLNPDEYLNSVEKESWESLKKVNSFLKVCEFRLDRTIMILRDF
ncbi:DNA-directed RNA polymerase III subunit RPC3 [Lobulomyces angularis]|nr:DNA-directed RNA polymerase III subunit RPC3 [Lobulomyces angularis]